MDDAIGLGSFAVHVVVAVPRGAELVPVRVAERQVAVVEFLGDPVAVGRPIEQQPIPDPVGVVLDQLVVALTAREPVVARTSVQCVVTITAEQLVASLVAVQAVTTGSAVGAVVAAAAADDVLATDAPDHVVAASGENHVVARRPADGLAPTRADDRRSTTTAGGRCGCAGWAACRQRNSGRHHTREQCGNQ